MTKSNLSTISGVMFLLLSTESIAFDQYTLTDLGSLSGNFSLAYDINDHGDVVGVTKDSAGSMHGFLYTKETFHDLSDWYWARGINNRGQILDTFANVGQWNAETATVDWTDLTPLVSNSSTIQYSQRTSKINDRGEITGYRTQKLGAYRGAPQTREGFFISNGVVSILGGNLNNVCDDSQYFGVNNRSEAAFAGAAGAFVASNGTPIQIYPQGVGSSYAIKAINDVGEFIGTSSEIYPWYYSPAKGYVNAPAILALMSANSLNSTMEDINNQGLVVGVVSPDTGAFPQGVVERNASPSAGRGFVFSTVTDAAADLNSLIPVGTGWVLNGATAINDAGQIVGYGTTPEGTVHAFLLTPTHENP